MLVYRTDDHLVEARLVVDRLAERIEGLKNPPHDELMSVFIEFGEIEWSRRIPVIGVLPPGVSVEHTIQINTDDWFLRILEVHRAGLPGHHDQTTISGPRSREDMTTSDHRKAAEDHLQSLMAEVQAQPKSAARDAFLDECAALAIAIRAFHMEAIRFRMFNVDRMIARNVLTLSDDARRAFGEVRSELEAAGFHTRSHQAPT
jgi:hypothetical protein